MELSDIRFNRKIIECAKIHGSRLLPLIDNRRQDDVMRRIIVFLKAVWDTDIPKNVIDILP